MQKSLVNSTRSRLETQASHFETSILGTESPRLQLARVPRDRAIEPDRYHLEISQPADRMTWAFPVQFSRHEAYTILGLLDEAIEAELWELSHADGFPVRSNEAYLLLECFIDGGVD